jgi:hypothetical protein
VVGIAWVVECVEQRALLNEAPYKVDLDGVNVAGTNKVRRMRDISVAFRLTTDCPMQRRKSKIPKTLASDLPRGVTSSHETGNESMRVDISMDGPSCMWLSLSNLCSIRF